MEYNPFQVSSRSFLFGLVGPRAAPMLDDTQCNGSESKRCGCVSLLKLPVASSTAYAILARLRTQMFFTRNNARFGHLFAKRGICGFHVSARASRAEVFALCVRHKQSRK